MAEVVSKPELLAPAGDRLSIRAAIENGADAIYFGLDCGFNARARANNLSPADLPEIVGEMHARGVKAYVTFNTLVFPDELKRAERHLKEIAASGVDAVLVQDLGIVRLIRGITPDLPIHASTQMTLTSAECIQAAQELGVERVVLARELSIDEISKIHQATSMELEVFVHGALCVAYSGQCLTSESLGGRSANRGQCAQACRLAYDLIQDGEDVDLGAQRYLLSPQDLAAYELTPDLIAAGVCSFKIEGRLKTPEYVANITRHYRQAIDNTVAGMEVNFNRHQRREMELSFSRGFSPGWLQGCDHKMLVPALSSAKRGVLLGRIHAIRDDRVAVLLQAPVRPGDGIVFEGNRELDEEQGGRVYEVFVKGRQRKEANSGIAELTFARRSIDFSELEEGIQVWKTDDPQLTKELRKSFTAADPIRRVSVELEVQAAVGQPLLVRGHAQNGATCRLQSEQPLEEARRHPLTTELLEDKLGRLGSTVFELTRLTAQIDGQPMVPLSVLGALRRQLVEQLENSTPTPQRQITDGALTVLQEEAANRSRVRENVEGITDNISPTLRVMCRTLLQLQGVLELGVRHVYVDFQDIREYRQAVEIVRQHNAEIFLATPRIQKPDELGIFRVLMRHEADGILVRNLAGLLYYNELGARTVADFSLNAANELTTEYLLEKQVERVTPSYDLNRDQMLDLVSATDPNLLEVVIHQHMPMFHMEHCVFCAVMSPGTNKHNCGRPCDFHQVELRDRIGMEHPLKADVGCRNTLFNAVPQSSAEVVPTLLERGIVNFRVELLDNDRESIQQILGSYSDLLAGRVTGKEVWSQLKASNRVGVTRGTLEERRNPLAII